MKRFTSQPIKPEGAEDQPAALQLSPSIRPSPTFDRALPPAAAGDQPSKAVRQVRPEVKEFLKQVVVPILVERYIASLNQKKLAARALEAE